MTRAAPGLFLIVPNEPLMSLGATQCTSNNVGRYL